jgi:tRNA (guanine-N7-)-methyltransferase
MASEGWVNPYRRRLVEFKNRIFSLEGDREEQAALTEFLRHESPRLVEIGSGSGQHLIELAKRNPTSACLGFEIRYKRSVRTIEKAAVMGIDNVYVLRTPGERLSELFPPCSADGIYVNFPDPWERPKQWKHRILSKGLLDQAFTVLRPSGFLSVKTDHESYFRTFREEVAADKRYRILESSDDLWASPYVLENVVTEFESLFRQQGLPIFYLKACPLK